MYRFPSMAADKLSTNLVTRVSETFKKQVEDLAAAYDTDPAEVVRLSVAENIKLWRLPGRTKRPKPKT